MYRGKSGVLLGSVSFTDNQIIASNKASEPVLSIYAGLCSSWELKLFIPCLGTPLPSVAGSTRHCTQGTGFPAISNEILNSVCPYPDEMQDLCHKEVRRGGLIVSSGQCQSLCPVTIVHRGPWAPAGAVHPRVPLLVPLERSRGIIWL